MSGHKSSPRIVFIGIGANLGPVRENFTRALREIEKYVHLVAVSSLYESDPVGPQDQPRFTNAVIKVETELSPFELLMRLKAIEKQIGREKTTRWGPRVIDLDIIFYGQLVINTDSLVIPHPRAHERRFVLEPLLEIEPAAWHPVKNMAVRDICSGLGDSQPISKTAGPKTLC
ncbi:MAG: 2-amino-4-hydroxy-6-hydroxymethyldihydropteridine diphosphokinase [Candidatus Dadabacteria bacterium]|nr:2-amino-4-hydroxy-6-hydroxymethyldihydropteridine diphosphokinase [Candidatus Dadabacteria bacterium]MCY4262066.1 2-amino-4-hydroxy-6-hydroxymethyldihydropteridine diphosphokinase [Candidatus Dadabacteria bacterium]